MYDFCGVWYLWSPNWDAIASVIQFVAILVTMWAAVYVPVRQHNIEQKTKQKEDRERGMALAFRGSFLLSLAVGEVGKKKQYCDDCVKGKRVFQPDVFEGQLRLDPAELTFLLDSAHMFGSIAGTAVIAAYTQFRMLQNWMPQPAQAAVDHFEIVVQKLENARAALDMWAQGKSQQEILAAINARTEPGAKPAGTD